MGSTARRLLFTAALVSSTGLIALAAERATLILVDGERKSGTLAYHLDKAETIITDKFQLNTSPGQEIQIPMDQIAVVEFLGGTPQANELQALPSDNSHLLVMRNGTTQRGRLVNFTNGETVKWQSDTGQAQDIPISDVSRIYLNASVARSVFNYNGTGTNAVGTTGQSAGAIQVNANTQWTDTGITVRSGDRYAFQASGQINFGRSPGQTAAPQGNAGQASGSFPIPNQPAGMLIGRIVGSGTFGRAVNGTPFAIGSNTQPITMPADGRLFLGINDDQLGDNSGFFTVNIAKQ